MRICGNRSPFGGLNLVLTSKACQQGHRKLIRKYKNFMLMNNILFTRLNQVFFFFLLYSSRRRFAASTKSLQRFLSYASFIIAISLIFSKSSSTQSIQRYRGLLRGLFSVGLLIKTLFIKLLFARYACLGLIQFFWILEYFGCLVC